MRIVPGVCLTVALMCLVSGCSSVMSVPPSGVAPAMIMSDVNYPSLHEAQTQFTFTRSDIEILGRVETTSESSSTLGIIASGDNGYGLLLKAARDKYPDADAVINIQWDTRYNAVCAGLITKVDSVVEGTAIKFKK